MWLKISVHIELFVYMKYLLLGLCVGEAPFCLYYRSIISVDIHMHATFMHYIKLNR